MQQNRITALFSAKTERLLNIYFTAGYPQLPDTLTVLRGLQHAGVDLIEIGMPYSDPVADGEVIQQSNMQALDNGMSLNVLFEQLATLRAEIDVPVLLMGYINPVLQYGVENFCRKCREVGIDGVILPDLPFDLYLAEYRGIFERYGILNTFLITPQTPDARILAIDRAANGFIYMVSSASITGSVTGISSDMKAYFERIRAMPLRNPRLIGFGINSRDTFDTATTYANGAIIGSAFVKHLHQYGAGAEGIKTFVEAIRP